MRNESAEKHTTCWRLYHTWTARYRLVSVSFHRTVDRLVLSSRRQRRSRLASGLLGWMHDVVYFWWETRAGYSFRHASFTGTRFSWSWWITVKRTEVVMLICKVWFKYTSRIPSRRRSLNLFCTWHFIYWLMIHGFDVVLEGGKNTDSSVLQLR